MNSVYHPPTLLLQDESKGLSRWFASRLGAKLGIKMSDKPLPLLPAVKAIIVPDGGWKPHTLYLVEVAFRKNNPIHEAYFMVGFVNDDGNPASYSELWSNSYDGPQQLTQVYYMKATKELHTEKD